MRAAMNWSAAVIDSPAVTSNHTTDVLQLKSRMANLPSNQTRVRLSNKVVIVGVKYNITVCAEADFSGDIACDSIFVERVGKKVPKIRLVKSIMKISPSRPLKLRGELSNMYNKVEVNIK